MKNLKRLPLIITVAIAVLLPIAIIMVAGCTPTEKKAAVIVQSDINAVTPAVTEGVDIGLTVSGKAALVPLNDAISGTVQNGQQKLLIELKDQANKTNPK